LAYQVIDMALCECAHLPMRSPSGIAR